MWKIVYITILCIVCVHFSELYKRFVYSLAIGIEKKGLISMEEKTVETKSSCVVCMLLYIACIVQFYMSDRYIYNKRPCWQCVLRVLHQLRYFLNKIQWFFYVPLVRSLQQIQSLLCACYYFRKPAVVFKKKQQWVFWKMEAYIPEMCRSFHFICLFIYIFRREWKYWLSPYKEVVWHPKRCMGEIFTVSCLKFRKMTYTGLNICWNS